MNINLLLGPPRVVVVEKGKQKNKKKNASVAFAGPAVVDRKAAVAVERQGDLTAAAATMGSIKPLSAAEQHTQDENIRNKVMREDGARWQDWPAAPAAAAADEHQDDLTAAAARTQCQNLRNKDQWNDGARWLRTRGIAFPAGVTRTISKTKSRATSPKAQVREITLPGGYSARNSKENTSSNRQIAPHAMSWVWLKLSVKIGHGRSPVKTESLTRRDPNGVLKILKMYRDPLQSRKVKMAGLEWST